MKLYKKFAIEVTMRESILVDVSINGNGVIDNVSIRLNKTFDTVNITRFVDGCFINNETAYYFTYKEAYESLQLNYDKLLSTYNNITSFKIVEIYDTFKLPIKIERKQKLDEINNN